MKAISLVPALLFALTISAKCAFCSQGIKVRVVSADGQPLAGQTILISFLYDSQRKPANSPESVTLNTDGKGEVSVSLLDPPPEHIGVQIKLTSQNWRCACTTLATTQDVFRTGIVVTSPAAKPKTSTEPRPGEILFTPRPLTFFERLLQPLVKQ